MKKIITPFIITIITYLFSLFHSGTYKIIEWNINTIFLGILIFISFNFYWFYYVMLKKYENKKRKI
jgi:hypothetical protein